VDLRSPQAATFLGFLGRLRHLEYEYGVRLAVLFLLFAPLGGCADVNVPAPNLRKERPAPKVVLERGTYVPDQPEVERVGAISGRIARGTVPFHRLVRCDAANVLFKDEEGTGADRLMTPRLEQRLERLAALVQREWPELTVRVTEAWDESNEHGERSLHYEGRALDLTTSDLDGERLGRLAGLALAAGFEWVAHEPTHVHASVAR
jgi:hypothetical protein